MNILFDLSHPAHVHLFRNLIRELEHAKHNVYVTIKDIKSAIDLLKLYDIKYYNIGYKSDSLYGKLFKQFKYDTKILKYTLKYDIDIGIGSSVSIANISKISNMKSIVCDDDDPEIVPLFTNLAHRFGNHIMTPTTIKLKRFKNKQISYPGTHELAYLHPKRFKPDISIVQELGLKPAEPYIIMRFNAFKAHHDIGAKGISKQNQLKLINKLEKYGKIYITTEANIDPDLQKYQLKVSSEKIHHVLYYSKLFVGDSQTMTSEAAILGVPSFKCNTFAGRLSVPNELEYKYKLCYSFLPKDFDKMITEIEKIMQNNDHKIIWDERRHLLLLDKIDVTGFWFWFIQNYPNSIKDLQNIKWEYFK